VTRAERGWLAGILDGEGSIAVWFSKRPNSKREHFHRQIVIYNTDPRIIHKARDLVEQITGLGTMRTYAVGMSHYPGAFDRHSVHVTQPSHIIKVCRTLIPDLVGKKDQAILMAQHLEWRAGMIRKPPEPCPEEVCRRDKKLAERLSYLNRFGPRTRNGHTEGSLKAEDMVSSPE